MAAGTIEVAPLAYMRGRTLNDSFIILDEAQNTSAEQMKMFLTRLGFGSRGGVTGDITQVGPPARQASRVRLGRARIPGRGGNQFARLASHDVVRHRLVGDIVNAYAAYEARTGSTVTGPVRDGAIRGRAERGDGRANSRGPRKRAQ